jgi:uncharacterized membrane protein
MKEKNIQGTHHLALFRSTGYDLSAFFFPTFRVPSCLFIHVALEKKNREKYTHLIFSM